MSGNVIAITDDTGTVAAKFSYTPFGEVIESVVDRPACDIPVGFAGQYGVLREPNGLYYMNARYYDPSLGRFLSEDPLGFGGGDLTLYSYAGNNPVVFVDPSGLCSQGSGTYLNEGAPPIPVPGGDAGTKWKFSPDPKNSRGGTWRPSPAIPGRGQKGLGQPSGSWDNDGHWDIDDGLGNRNRYLPDGTSITPEQAHPDRNFNFTLTPPDQKYIAPILPLLMMGALILAF
jgi:RHS repeat-associated protein